MKTEEFVRRLQALVPVLDAVWQQIVKDDIYWQQRIDGPVYRRTPILGRFRWYRRLRTWWLRRQF